MRHTRCSRARSISQGSRPSATVSLCLFADVIRCSLLGALRGPVQPNGQEPRLVGRQDDAGVADTEVDDAVALIGQKHARGVSVVAFAAHAVDLQHVSQELRSLVTACDTPARVARRICICRS